MLTRLTLGFYILLISISFAQAEGSVINEFSLGTAKFKISAEIKKVTTSLGSDSALVTYSIYKDGKFMHPDIDRIGGRLLGCKMGSPTDVISPLTVDSKQLGWWIKLGGICGNTNSFLMQLILVSPKEDNYTVREFLSKSSPIVRAKGNQAEIWFTSQEWGHGGTATSFMVAHRIMLHLDERSPSNVTLDPLPADFSQWPKMEYVSSFPSFFVSGLEDLNSAVMIAAVQKYYQVSDQGWYETIGLAKSREECMSLASSMGAVSSKLKLFPPYSLNAD